MTEVSQENNSFISKNLAATQSPQSSRRFKKNRGSDADAVMKVSVDADADTFGTIHIPNLEKERQKKKKKLLRKIKETTDEKHTLASKLFIFDIFPQNNKHFSERRNWK